MLGIVSHFANAWDRFPLVILCSNNAFSLLAQKWNSLVSTTFVDCFSLYFWPHFSRPIFLLLFVDPFSVDLFAFSRLLPFSQLLGSCWFLVLVPLTRCCHSIFLIFKNEVQRGSTTWVTSSLKLFFYLTPTGGEKDEHCIHSPPRGPVWGLFRPCHMHSH